MKMFETITMNQPYEYGKWGAALKSKLWGLQLLYGGNWPKDTN